MLNMLHFPDVRDSDISSFLKKDPKWLSILLKDHHTQCVHGVALCQLIHFVQLVVKSTNHFDFPLGSFLGIKAL